MIYSRKKQSVIHEYQIIMHKVHTIQGKQQYIVYHTHQHVINYRYSNIVQVGIHSGDITTDNPCYGLGLSVANNTLNIS